MLDPVSPIMRFEKAYGRICTASEEEFASQYETFHGGYSAAIQEKAGKGSTSSLSTAAVCGLSLAFARWNFGLRGRLLSDTDHFCVRYPLAGTSKTIEQQSGLSGSTGEIAVFSAKEGVETLAAPHNSALNLAIPRALIIGCAESYSQSSVDDTFDFTSPVGLGTLQGGVLRSLFDHLLTGLVGTPSMFENPMVARCLQEHVAHTILNAVPHRHYELAKSARHTAIPLTVKRAEDFMRAHAAQPLTLAMICDHVSCGLRALQNAFKQYRDTTPMGALQDIRLELARRDLKVDKGSVTQVALKWGFSNPGRFSAIYRERFGEKPSDTGRLVYCPSYVESSVRH